jgi:hypothetical protein
MLGDCLERMKEIEDGSEPDPRDEVVSWAQACLTALNCGDIAKDSKFHHKLREVMIEYRRKIND